MKERKVHWVAMTTDKKVGPVMASYSPLDTCPDSCSFKSGGCYAWELFYLRVLGKKISDGRIKIRTIEEAFNNSRRSAKIVRHRVAGDIVGDVDGTMRECEFADENNLINIGYTHDWRNPESQKLKKWFRASCNTLEEMQEAIDMGWSVTITAYGENIPKKTKLLNRRAVLCPAQVDKRIDCNTCKMCKTSGTTKDTIIIFETHGVKVTVERANKNSLDMDLVQIAG